MPQPTRNRSSTKTNLKFIFFIFLIIASIFAEIWFDFDIEPYKEALISYPIIVSGAVFVLLYVGVTFFLLFSRTLFQVTAAILFGPYPATVLVTVAELINAMILFNLSRIDADLIVLIISLINPLDNNLIAVSLGIQRL